MSSIADFPGEPKYTIKNVCNQIRIRPVTLRAWERRHDILTPFRSDNHYRLYSERDIALLRWIKHRVDTGISISNVAIELHAMMKNGLWPDALPNAPEIKVDGISNDPSYYANKIYDALVNHDEGQAGELLREVQSTFDLLTTFEKFLIPALVNIGDAWYNGKIRITTEHFASAYLRGRLLSLLQAYPSHRSAPNILIGCAPTEQHEIGSLMLSVLVRSQGYRVEFLGPDIPLDDLVDYASDEHPDMIILSATMAESARELERMTDKLKPLRQRPVFAYGGAAFQIKPKLRQKIQGLYLGDTLADSMNTINTLLSKNGAHSRKNKA